MPHDAPSAWPHGAPRVGDSAALTRTDQTLAILFWMLVVQSTAGLLPALYVWTWPPTHLWGWVVVIAFCGTFSHYCMARALLHADATVVIPMDFLRVPLTAAAGWLIYSERLDVLTVLNSHRQSVEPETESLARARQELILVSPAVIQITRRSVSRG